MSREHRVLSFFCNNWFATRVDTIKKRKKITSQEKQKPLAIQLIL